VSAARERLVGAALTLFARHGVSGTSLQMIAGELGVTKAAVYHQFPTKEAIVLAVVVPAIDRLAGVISAAAGHPTAAGRREVTLRGLVDLIVSHRSLALILYQDPVVVDLVRTDPALRMYGDRISALLAGAKPDTATMVAVSVVGGGLAGAAVDPRLADVDDATLRLHLLTTGRRILRVRG
jgi:AcrR family transcriptional regulator